MAPRTEFFEGHGRDAVLIPNFGFLRKMNGSPYASHFFVLNGGFDIATPNDTGAAVVQVEGGSLTPHSPLRMPAVHEENCLGRVTPDFWLRLRQTMYIRPLMFEKNCDLAGSGRAVDSPTSRL